MEKVRRMRRPVAGIGLLLGMMVSSSSGQAQLTRSDYDRALDLQERDNGLIDHLPEPPEWIKGTDRFVYRESIRVATGEKPGAFRFVLVDAHTQSSQPAFDARRIAESLAKASGTPVEADRLPFTSFHFEEEQRAIAFQIGDVKWNCHLMDYACAKQADGEKRDPDDEGYDSTPKPENGDEHAVKSPDGKWTAFILNNNLVLRPLSAQAPIDTAKDTHGDEKKQPAVLSTDGTAGDYYAISTIAWSQDSKHVAVYRIRPGYRRVVDYVESSP